MSASSAGRRTSTGPAPDDLHPVPHTLGRSLLLHLLPGVAVAAVYVALVPVARALQLPTGAALAAAGLVCVGPLLLGLLALVSGRRRGADAPAVMFRGRPPFRTVLGYALLLLVWAATVFALTGPLSGWVEATVFGWWPVGWKPELGTGGGYGRGALCWTALLLVLGSAVVAPVAEELYFRGFLLPRMPAALGRTAPLVHTVLFALYHLWTPWLTPTRILAVLPLVLVTLRTRSLWPAVAAHIAINAVDAAIVVAYLITWS